MASAAPTDGACEFQQWANALRFELGSDGKEDLLEGNGMAVVMDYARSDMERAAADLQVYPGCSVLEIGFGLGFASAVIQSRRPATHVIVECAPAVLERLRAWAKDKPSVTVVEGTWQKSLPALSHFDRIFFDASNDVAMNAAAMQRCPSAAHRDAYTERMAQGFRPTVFEGFEHLARRMHLKDEGLICSGDGSEFRQWADGLFFSLDKEGNQQLLDADGMQVMMEWERPWMVRCVEALNIDSSCDVLEVGFGCGYSANRIQQAGPRTHTIIECSEPVLERLRAWAADKPSVRVVEGTWQARLPELGTFDCIFFDDYGLPGHADREMERCTKKAYRDVYSATLDLDGGSHFEAFLHIAFRWHARKGTRMSGFVMHPILTAEEDGVEATYHRMDIAVPDHCNYFFSNKAIVPLFVRTRDTVGPKTEAMEMAVEVPSQSEVASKEIISPQLSVSTAVGTESREPSPFSLSSNSPSPSRSRSRSRRRAARGKQDAQETSSQCKLGETSVA